jgi:hypothetical protein
MALKDTYRYLQKYAVGIEQVVWDQMDSNGPFKNQFADIEFKLRAVSGIYIPVFIMVCLPMSPHVYEACMNLLPDRHDA